MGNCISPLRRAIRFQDTKAVKEILDDAGEGAPDLINEDYTADCFIACFIRNYQSVLHSATTHNDVVGQQVNEIVQLLILYGADVNSPGLWGQTVLHKACRQDCLPLAKYFIENGADVYAQSYVESDNFGFLPVHCAAMSIMARIYKKHEVLQYLLEELLKPEDLQIEDAKGNSPLHVACMWDNTSTAAYLIDKGADLYAKNHDGKIPKEVSKPQAYELVAKAMKENQ